MQLNATGCPSSSARVLDNLYTELFSRFPSPRTTNLIFPPIMLEYGSYVPEDLRKHDIPHLKELGRKLVMDTNLVLSDPYGYIMKKVIGGTHFAIITIDYLLYTLNLKNLLSSTYIVDDSIYKNYITWYLPKNTAFTPIISDLLTRLLETGIIGKRYEQHVGGYSRRVKRARGDGILNIGHLQGAFILLVLGLGAALLILLLEYLIKPCSLNSTSN
ncbi:hypothetical protein Pcinc_031026 [Petrolisthes cinctipes]|uniref:Uncharacterized protein n=1 Tax=Petrolisthes cinctipes TaxID=88211 RepID=A0AAE1EWX9_PETCI|nr:hypothetical protein Pcinc_031026 [Petrolisthes cinctipes]